MLNKNLLSVEDAINKIVKTLKTLKDEDIKLTECLGRVSAKKIISQLNNPPTDVSSMDGYAISSEKIFKSYKVIGESSAGNPFKKSVNPKEAVQIFTGAYLPKGTNTVVIQENTKIIDKDNISFKKNKIEKNDNVRKKGLDFKKGSTVLKGNHIINSRDISTIAMSGNFHINVRTKPKIGILSTGDEIEKVGNSLKKDKIPSGNNVMLASMINIFGGLPRILPIAKDNLNNIENTLSKNLDCDLLVTTGGASVGKYDFLSSLFEKHKKFTNIKFWKIAMRPGKPLIFGSFKKVPIIGLPGNPVSAGVCSLIFLRVAINKMLGLKDYFPDIHQGITTTTINKNDQRMDFIRSKLEINKKNFLTPFKKQDSSMTNLFSRSNCLILRKPFEKKSLPGDLVNFIKFPDNF